MSLFGDLVPVLSVGDMITHRKDDAKYGRLYLILGPGKHVRNTFVSRYHQRFEYPVYRYLVWDITKGRIHDAEVAPNSNWSVFAMFKESATVLHHVEND